MKRIQLKKLCIVFSLGMILILSATYIYSREYTIFAKIESKRKDNIVTLLFNEKPIYSNYYIIQNKTVIGSIIILDQSSYTTGTEIIHRATARYHFSDTRNRPLIRVGTEIGLVTNKKQFERDYSDKGKEKKVEYKKSIVTLQDQRTMLLVGRGKFVFGSNNGESDEYPEQVLYLKDFYIDKYEVSNNDYLRFVKDARQKPPLSWGGKMLKDKEVALPVLVTYYEAKLYAKWAEKRLPTETEWEKASRGPGLELVKNQDKYIVMRNPISYPWGNRFKPGISNSIELWKEKRVSKDIFDIYKQGLLPVKYFSNKGDSPYGIVNLSGNAKEWTSSWYQAYKGNTYPHKRYGQQVKVVKGGAWYNTRHRLRSSSREYAGIPNLEKDFTAGFRCVKDPTIVDIKQK